MAKTPNEYIAISLEGKSDAFRTAYADMQDAYETHQAEMRRLGTALLDAATADGFRAPLGKQARIVLSRFDGKPQIMISDAATPRRSF